MALNIKNTRLYDHTGYY